jgi:hypothetical protein
MPSLDTLIARIALSLWTSNRTVERLPVVRTWSPRQLVTLVACPAHLSQMLAIRSTVEGI